jgi:hypothetical protein
VHLGTTRGVERTVTSDLSRARSVAVDQLRIVAATSRASRKSHGRIAHHHALQVDAIVFGTASFVLLALIVVS